MDECDMEKFGTLDSSEKAISILGHRWWPQTAKQDGDKTSKTFLYNVWKNVMNAQTLRSVSIRSRNGALSRKGCMRGQRSND